MGGWKSQTYSINSNPSVEDRNCPAKPERDAISKGVDHAFGVQRQKVDDLEAEAKELESALIKEVWDEC